MRYAKKEFWRRLAALNQINERFQKRNIRREMPGLEELAGCQSIALEMGTCLETIGTIAESAVSLLESYCENIYQQSIHLNDYTACRLIAQKIQEQLSQLKSIIQYDLPEGKKEIVFLPYKASMWDSLESVWMAAKEDKNCESLVIPIPYFDKNPDGSFGQMHNERDQYPDYVSVIDWQEYSISERRPDAIYIHNPYDEGNYVTSVHPAFYSKELKKYTEMLVYIPYFLEINNHVEEHFCILPGIKYADRVILENEEVKKIYIDTIREFEKEKHCQGLFGNLDQKFLALGSPKFDRIRKVTRESIDIPESWKRVLIARDGNRKKIILYNTTISSFLANSKAAIKKIRHTLQMFKENSDVVLLWRPHPLLVATVRSMRPSLYPEFCRIIQEYKEEGWGIYDNTADVERAIVLSDAYYGDWSSVVALYQATGKPIMIQHYGEEK